MFSMKILYSNTSFVTMIFNISSCSISLCMRVVARLAARAFALLIDLAARVAISCECFGDGGKAVIVRNFARSQLSGYGV